MRGLRPAFLESVPRGLPASEEKATDTQQYTYTDNYQFVAHDFQPGLRHPAAHLWALAFLALPNCPGSALGAAKNLVIR